MASPEAGANMLGVNTLNSISIDPADYELNIKVEVRCFVHRLKPSPPWAAALRCRDQPLLICDGLSTVPLHLSDWACSALATVRGRRNSPEQPAACRARYGLQEVVASLFVLPSG